MMISSSPFLEVERLGKSFGDVAAVREVSFAVQPGEIVALLGPNGSGKTTTLKMIAGLIHPTAGKIRVCGHDLMTARDQAIGMLSYLPQRVEFPKNLSAREIVDFYAGLRSVSSETARAALQRTSFNGFADRPVGEYSGGMVQRLGLAVASLPQAPLLLLDEPTVSLDPAGVQDFRQYVLDQKISGRAVVFTTHLLGEAERLADRIGILVSGRLVMMEKVENVRQRVFEHGSLEAFYLDLVNDDKRTQRGQIAI
jgi:Cu-processing system ATP-binding protein